MVLALPHSSLDYPAVAVAAELAECLGVQCVGTFIVEPAIASLDGRPGLQEFRSIARGWQPVESGDLSRDIEQVTASARRAFSAAFGRKTTEGIFHVERGGTGQLLASLAGRDDILVMIEPRHPIERITHQFRNILHAAFETSSAVMLMPSRILRERGPIVAIAAAEDDPAIRLASEVAGLTKESLLIINATDGPIARQAIPFGQRQGRIIASPTNGLPIDARVLADLGNAGERLIVARRKVLAESGTRAVVERRGVPVLLAGDSN
jgi:hypothetical protein